MPIHLFNSDVELKQIASPEIERGVQHLQEDALTNKASSNSIIFSYIVDRILSHILLFVNI
jgi:hypothetical protein